MFVSVCSPFATVNCRTSTTSTTTSVSYKFENNLVWVKHHVHILCHNSLPPRVLLVQVPHMYFQFVHTKWFVMAQGALSSS